jgi:hypothetical protein
MDGFGDLMRMVNRSDGVVDTVLVNGRVAFENGAPVPALGRECGFGTFLPADGPAQPQHRAQGIAEAA